MTAQVFLRDTIVNMVKSSVEIKKLLGEYKFKIVIGKEGVSIRQCKILVKRKISVISKEDIARRELLRNAVRDRTGVLYISGLVQQLLKEIRKHHLGKYDERIQGSLGVLYGKLSETLVKEVKSGKGIEQNRNRVIDVTGKR